MATPVGPITVQVAPGRPAGADDSQPATSGVYRNKAAAAALPETYNGCATLFELFNKAVEEHGDNRCGGVGGPGGRQAASCRWVVPGACRPPS